MFVLMVKGARNTTLATHKFESHAELSDLSEVYQALGYKPEALIVEERPQGQNQAEAPADR